MTARLQDIKQRISRTLDSIEGIIANSDGGESITLEQIVAQLVALGIAPSNTPSIADDAASPNELGNGGGSSGSSSNAPQISGGE